MGRSVHRRWDPACLARRSEGKWRLSFLPRTPRSAEGLVPAGQSRHRVGALCTAPGNQQAMMNGHVIRNRDDLIEVLRSRKEQLGLSNAFVDAQLQLADGGCDKVLGPTQARGMGAAVLLDMVELFGARLVIQVDAETEARMQKRWEHREERNVRQQQRLSKRLLEIATSQFYQRLSKLGNEARKAKLPPEARSNIARAAALARWDRHRAAVKTRPLKGKRAQLSQGSKSLGFRRHHSGEPGLRSS
jgi:hypothetical protein